MRVRVIECFALGSSCFEAFEGDKYEDGQRAE